MKVTCSPTIGPSDSFDMLVLPYWENGVPASSMSIAKEQVAEALKTGDFKGKLAETLILYAKSGRILLLGLGKQEGALGENFRRAYAAAVRAAQAKKLRTLHVALPREKGSLTAVAEGIFLTNYAYSRLKGAEAKEDLPVLLEKAVFIGESEAEEPLLRTCRILAEAVCLARDLVNGNADEITPEKLAETAKLWEGSSPSLKASILGKKEIQKEKMGLLLAVNRASSLEPRLIQLAYRGNPNSDEHTVLIGKGITYDTGGLSLKPTDNMLTMKCDMSGAAAVLAAVKAAADLRLKVNVTALVPATENAIDANSYKPGDVYISMSGKTVEITNTDAEGRLVLADAITYAAVHLKPTQIIDLATLTGAIVVALGEEMSGLFATNDRLAEELLAASQATGEQLWRMPLNPDYKEMLKSDIADMVNSAGRSASSVTAALFLKEFVPPAIPWAHIDCAGPAFLSKPKSYYPTKGTGFGVRLLVDFLRRRSE